MLRQISTFLSGGINAYFTADESIVDDPEKLDYPRDNDEARERMRKRVKLELLQAKVDDEKEDEALKKIAVKYRDRNRMVHQFNASDLLEFYLSSLSRTFDPHTTYGMVSAYESIHMAQRMGFAWNLWNLYDHGTLVEMIM